MISLETISKAHLEAARSSRPVLAVLDEALQLSPGDFVAQLAINTTFGVVIGIFLHISTAIMFETGENHRYNIAKIMSMIAGVLLAALIS